MRTFIAVELPDAVKRRVVEQQRRIERQLVQAQLAGCIRWTIPSNLHLTLRFLGDSDEGQIETVRSDLAQIAAASAPLKLALGRLGCFPNFRRPNIVWLDFEGDLAPLKALQRACEAAARSAGFAPEERPFTPHLTVGRAQRSATDTQLQCCGEQFRTLSGVAARPDIAQTFSVDQVILMQSDLRPEGPTYSALGSYRLGIMPCRHHKR